MDDSLADQEICVQGRSVTKKSPAHCKICCLWKDCSTYWEKLFNLKESHIVHLIKFAVVQEMIMNQLSTCELSILLRNESE